MRLGAFWPRVGDGRLGTVGWGRPASGRAVREAGARLARIRGTGTAGREGVEARGGRWIVDLVWPSARRRFAAGGRRCGGGLVRAPRRRWAAGDGMDVVRNHRAGYS